MQRGSHRTMPHIMKQIGKDAYWTAVNATCDDPWGNLLVPGEETKCLPALSRDTGRQYCREVAVAGTYLSLSCLSLFAWDLAAGKLIIWSHLGDVQNISAERPFSWKVLTSKGSLTALGHFLVFQIVNACLESIRNGIVLTICSTVSTAVDFS